jgi:hypothetical protein
MSTELNRSSGQIDSPNKEEKVKPEKDSGLKATFISVMLLGAFLVVTWTIVFILFISRQ